MDKRQTHYIVFLEAQDFCLFTATHSGGSRKLLSSDSGELVLGFGNSGCLPILQNRVAEARVVSRFGYTRTSLILT